MPVKHVVYVEHLVGNTRNVVLVNDEDGHYAQTFSTRADVEAFIGELRKAADEAFALDPTYQRCGFARDARYGGFERCVLRSGHSGEHEWPPAQSIEPSGPNDPKGGPVGLS